ncbi:hypothetical protein CLAFUW4_03635 [Fulvia fulva]|uniref:Aminoglycoside phosphotransferase domain-containing protein n=1 Tax=Passalora fulva TaxID=5499 RepID=A0A9Q8P5F5_PASFU|nr:uncharacterized protein CLAFUR5_03613 [Fulvia fulva]KAK4631696.1 hypothetical protein CLAFUR4_03623 [Fulvia fulva]KAK4633282.1 hypothetical protein CLAFUR0_03626 [Fulvia fulva]UJO14070.1 hypothetical protein CLAFUR5_03613 [Fulvia fulva]WPV11258.1 hypothetical protein CLAFUW4_03635 [Fulvia fulva]WPV25762.1 hypothetical protein CLAFUW7_03627 [Fulvia fulva]
MLLANEVTAIAPTSTSSGFNHEDIALCLTIAKAKYPAHRVQLLAQPGGCSLTLSATPPSSTVPSQSHDDDTIVIQFRLSRFSLKATIAHESRAIYGSLVPAPLCFEELDTSHGALLQMCAMTSIEGVRFSEVQPKEKCLGHGDVVRMETLMDGMARFFAVGRKSGNFERSMDGKVGKTILQRLRKLERELPLEWMRTEAGMVADAVERGGLECLPVVLNHGDLLPSNVLVDDKSWELSGLVDWAEAEYLPFGMTLYGIEHLLGFQHECSGTSTVPHFTSYAEAGVLRDRFWARLLEHIPELADIHVQAAVLLSRKIGTLLWHGFAWDDGKIDRVVNGADDLQEMAYLEAFCTATTDQQRSKL